MTRRAAAVRAPRGPWPRALWPRGLWSRGSWSRGCVAAALAAMLLGACSTPTSVDGTSSPSGPAPIADRPIDLDGRCAQTDETGFREEATLRVSGSVVQSLSWRLWVGKRGGCSFEQSDFRQTRRGPHIEMVARDGSGCRLMVWQDARRITLAHSGCERRCTPGVYEQAWPVMFDPRSGSCARL